MITFICLHTRFSFILDCNSRISNQHKIRIQLPRNILSRWRTDFEKNKFKSQCEAGKQIVRKYCSRLTSYVRVSISHSFYFTVNEKKWSIWFIEFSNCDLMPPNVSGFQSTSFFIFILVKTVQTPNSTNQINLCLQLGGSNSNPPSITVRLIVWFIYPVTYLYWCCYSTRSFQNRFSGICEKVTTDFAFTIDYRCVYIDLFLNVLPEPNNFHRISSFLRRVRDNIVWAVWVSATFTLFIFVFKSDDTQLTLLMD